MKRYVLLLLTVLQTCICRRPIDVAILYSKEDKLIDTAITYVERRHTMLSEYILVPHILDVDDMDSFKLGQTLCEITSKGILAIFGPSTGKNNAIVQSISENLELPQFQNFWNPNMINFVYSKRSNTQVLNTYPDSKLLAHAIATLVKDMEWRTYTILYEDDDSLIRLQEVLKIPRSDDFPIKIRKLLPGNDQRPLLKEIRAKSEMHIVLDCQAHKIPNILEQAALYNLTEEYHNYVLTSLDAHTLDFSKLIDSGANITTLRLIDPSSEDVRYVVGDWVFMEKQWNNSISITPDKLKLETALMYDNLVRFLTAFEELALTGQPPRSVPQICRDLDLSEDGLRMGAYIAGKPYFNGTLHGPLTGPIEFDQYGRRINFKLQIVELTPEGFRLTANWFSQRPGDLQYIVSEEERQQEFEKHLHHKIFRVASRIGAPYLMHRQPKKNEVLEKNSRFEGFTLDIVDEIAKILNFSYELELVPDNNYGSYDPVRKEWNGLIRQILDRKADLAICDLTITYERGRAVDFSMPFMTLGISILFSTAVKKPPQLFAFMEPLSLDIWLHMAIAYVLMSIIIYIAARLAPQDWENPHPCDPEPTELENIWTIKNCFWLTMGSIMTQGCDILPKGISTRMIAGMWWFFSLIITSSYTANLAAFLTNERMGPTIESAEDLAKQSEIKYGCVEGGATSTFFRDSNFSTYQKMWRHMQNAEPSVFETSNKDGVKRVLTSKRKYAFLMESSNIDYEMERNCELMQVGEWLDIKNYGIAMPINSPYNAAISGAVLKMQEEGKLHRLKEKWWKEMHGGGKCSKEEKSDDGSAAELGIDHVGGVFVVLTGGIGIAFLIAIFEFLWNVRKISVQAQITPREALARELQFAVNVRKRKKAIVKKSETTQRDF